MINKLMQYPLISEYLAAIRDAHDNLDKLSHLVPVLDNYGEPYRSSGAFAVVFKMKDEQTGKCYALKCFTEEQEGRAEAYRQIAEELEFVNSPYITYVKYLEKELFVDSNCDDEEFPVLLMDWIEGETMETYIAANYTDTHAMAMLCYRFCKMAAWLRSQSFAHGDIKPDNIMVRPDGTLTLVDYDGMFVPAMKGQKSPTIGTKDFSHPLRAIDDFDETIDDFALASIALSLKAISLNPSLLDEYGASDRLLFSAADYLDLSKSKTMTALQGLLADEEARTLMSMFLLASAKKDLSMCSFRLFGLQKPKEEEVWSTKVTKEDLENAVEDEFGVKYSKDWKRLLKAPEILSGKYSIRKGVKVIGGLAFAYCKSLTIINIPNSVTTIGEWAFFNCNSLTNINIPNSVTTIGENAFCLCDSLTSINIPNSVTTIGNSAFLDCVSLTNINIPNSVTTIGDSTFDLCESLTNINIPNSVTTIGKGAFSGCKSLTSINIPNSVTMIGDSAFDGCRSLTSITIPSSVVTIIGNSFCGWHGILNNESNAFIYEDHVLFNKNKTTLIAYRAKETNYTIPNSVTTIGEGAFSGCESLISINIPNSVTTIGDSAFWGCKSLVNINIPNSVTTIGKNAFAWCDSLTSINIPNSVTTIGDWGLGTCKSLTSITIPNSVVTIIGNPFYHWHGNLYNESKAFIYEDHVLFNKNKTTLIAYRAKETNYTIPNSVTTIGECAFCGCESLTSINIPNSVTTIGAGAFGGCESLTNINIPNSVTTIGEYAFCHCDFLTNINIPNGVTTIGKYAFSDCKSLTNINIPNSVTRIGKSAFRLCKSLTSINIPNSVTTIGDEAFRDCASLTNINIPNSVTTIEDGAFRDCENLPSHIKSDIIQRFGEKVFK